MSNFLFAVKFALIQKKYFLKIEYLFFAIFYGFVTNNLNRKSADNTKMGQISDDVYPLM